MNHPGTLDSVLLNFIKACDSLSGSSKYPSSLMLSLPVIYYVTHWKPLLLLSCPWFHAHYSMLPPILLPLAQFPERIQLFLTWTLYCLLSSCSVFLLRSSEHLPSCEQTRLCFICHSLSCPFLYSSFILNEGIMYSALFTHGSLTFVGKERVWLSHCPVPGASIEQSPSPWLS